MFKRRIPLSWPARIRETLFPRKGFSRFYSYHIQRILRMRGTPYSLACGFACGVGVSFTPLIGFHLILAALFAYILRGNLITAGVGTLVGNPWTFPFIFVLLHQIGDRIIGYFGVELWLYPSNSPGVYEQFLNYFIPISIGGMIMAIISWIISYGLCYLGITHWREHRRLRRLAKNKDT